MGLHRRLRGFRHRQARRAIIRWACSPAISISDGLTDIYVACDQTPSILYINQGNGKFC